MLEYRGGERNYVIMSDGRQLDVSKRKLSEFLDLFEKL